MSNNVESSEAKHRKRGICYKCGDLAFSPRSTLCAGHRNRSSYYTLPRPRARKPMDPKDMAHTPDYERSSTVEMATAHHLQHLGTENFARFVDSILVGDRGYTGTYKARGTQ